MDMYLNFPDVICMCIILAARHQQQAHDAFHPVSSTVSSVATLRYVDFVYLKNLYYNNSSLEHIPCDLHLLHLHPAVRLSAQRWELWYYNSLHALVDSIYLCHRSHRLRKRDWKPLMWAIEHVHALCVVVSLIPSPLSRTWREAVWRNMYRARVARAMYSARQSDALIKSHDCAGMNGIHINDCARARSYKI